MDQGPVVLLLEDDEAVAKAHAALLTRASIRVDVCASPLRALSRISAGERFDVVLCDGEMPELGGVQFFLQARAVWPELDERIVFLSAGLPAEDERVVHDYSLPLLSKPLLEPGGLGAVVRARVARVSSANNASGSSLSRG